MIPIRRPGQSFAEHQAEMAEWLGTDVATMNATHDRLHKAMAAWLGVPSLAMRDAAGEPLSLEHQLLAIFEEQAVLMTARWMHHAGAEVPDG